MSLGEADERRVKELLKDIYGDSNESMLDTLDTLDCYEKLRDSTKYDEKTKLLYVETVCRVLEERCGKTSREYGILRHEMRKRRQIATKAVIWFPNLYKRAKYLRRNAESTVTKVVSLMIVTNVNEQEDGSLKPDKGEMGILLLTDIGVSPDHESWRTKAECSVKGRNRSISLSKAFMEGIKEICGERNPPSPWRDHNRLTDYEIIMRDFGCSIGDIRASYFTWRDLTEKDDRLSLKRLCENQGRTYTETMMMYKGITGPEYLGPWAEDGSDLGDRVRSAEARSYCGGSDSDMYRLSDDEEA